MKDLGAQGEVLGKLVLQQPSREPVVAIARAGVAPESAAAIAGPVSKILLQPDRQESPQLAAAQPA
jgi:hypothetical protein